MSDIVEFLLARIAEDEERAESIRAAYADEATFWVPAVVINAAALVVPDRVLAECKAKRAIITDQQSIPDVSTLMFSPPPGANVQALMSARFHADVVLRALASVYADHPDYDRGWATG